MLREIGPVADELDFSKYRPGDVITISMREFARRDQASSIMLVAAICNAASRAGLKWKTERDECNDGLRVSFS